MLPSLASLPARCGGAGFRQLAPIVSSSSRNTPCPSSAPRDRHQGQSAASSHAVEPPHIHQAPESSA
eukprot:8635160-Heterocapsa_arctica.AAC.1